MKFVVCYKLVPGENSIVVKPDRSLDFTNCEWEIGQYDLRAVETAAQLTQAVLPFATLKPYASDCQRATTRMVAVVEVSD